MLDIQVQTVETRVQGFGHQRADQAFADRGIAQDRGEILIADISVNVVDHAPDVDAQRVRAPHVLRIRERGKTARRIRQRIPGRRDHVHAGGRLRDHLEVRIISFCVDLLEHQQDVMAELNARELRHPAHDRGDLCRDLPQMLRGHISHDAAPADLNPVVDGREHAHLGPRGHVREDRALRAAAIADLRAASGGRRPDLIAVQDLDKHPVRLRVVRDVDIVERLHHLRGHIDPAVLHDKARDVELRALAADGPAGLALRDPYDLLRIHVAESAVGIVIKAVRQILIGEVQVNVDVPAASHRGRRLKVRDLHIIHKDRHAAFFNAQILVQIHPLLRVAEVSVCQNASDRRDHDDHDQENQRFRKAAPSAPRIPASGILVT